MRNSTLPLARAPPTGLEPAGTGDWAGPFNTYFWVDRPGGLAAALFTQMLPFFEPRVIELLIGFEQAVYAGARPSAAPDQAPVRGGPLAQDELGDYTTSAVTGAICGGTQLVVVGAGGHFGPPCAVHGAPTSCAIDWHREVVAPAR